MFVLLLYTGCILSLRHPDDGHSSDRNMLVTEHIVDRANVHLSVHHKSKQHTVDTAETEWQCHREKWRAVVDTAMNPRVS
jgi:hypothetical protein